MIASVKAQVGACLSNYMELIPEEQCSSECAFDWFIKSANYAEEFSLRRSHLH